MDPFEHLDREDREFTYALDENRERKGLPPFGTVLQEEGDGWGRVCPACEEDILYEGLTEEETECLSCHWPKTKLVSGNA